MKKENLMLKIKNRDSDKNPGFYIIVKFYILSRIDCKLSEKYFICNKTILSFISPLLIRVSICSLSSFRASFLFPTEPLALLRFLFYCR